MYAKVIEILNNFNKLNMIEKMLGFKKSHWKRKHLGLGSNCERRLDRLFLANKSNKFLLKCNYVISLFFK